MKHGWSWVALLLLVTVRVGVAPSAPTAGEPAAETKTPTVSGQVVSAVTGRPLPGARVEAFVQDDAETARRRHASGDSMGQAAGVCAADSTGRFELGVPAGKRLVIVAQSTGHTRSFFTRPLVLAERAQRDLGRLELQEGRRLRGRVLDTAGKPVAGAKVTALPTRRSAGRAAGAGFARINVSTAQLPAAPVSAITGPDGAFALESLPDATLTLRAHADGMAPGVVENVRPSSSAAAGVTLKLEPGHSLAGRVVGPDGTTPIADAWVVAGEEGWDGLARSEKDGSFRLASVRTGTHSLVATLSSTLVLEAGAIASTAQPAWAYAPSIPLPVAVTPPAGPPPGGPRAAEPPAATAPVLKLRPGGWVRARAIDSETRLPLAAAAITLEAPGEGQPRPATTGGQGEVIFTGVPAGSIRLRAQSDGYLPASFDGAPLSAGQVRQWSAALRPAASLEGTVRDAAGRPVPGAQVSVAGPPPMALPARLFLPIGIEPVTADAEGRFVVEDLPSRDELKVTVEAAGFSPWEMAGIELRPGERRTGLEVLLDAGAVVTGRVLRSDGRPLPAASVTASRRMEGGPGSMVIRIDGGARQGGAARGIARSRAQGPGMPRLGGGEAALSPVLTGADGVFRAQGAKPGVWSVAVSMKGFAPKVAAGLKLEEGGGSLDAGEIVMEPGATLKGRVTTPAGEPVAHARGTVRQDFFVISTFSTGEDGAFVTDDLAPGDTVTMTIDAEGYAAAERHGLTAPVEDLDITLVPASRVLGHVLERETRQPIPDFSIGMSRMRSGGGGGMMMNVAIAGPETQFHAEDGSFVVEDVDPGKVVITASAPGYRESVLRDLEVPEGKDLEGVAFTLDRSATISGTVLDDKGRPLPGASVSRKQTTGGMGMVMRGPRSGDAAVTDGDGGFVLSGLERGPLTLSFAHADYEPAERDLDTSRDVEGLRVTLSRGTTLTGIVLREEDGSPVPGASVSAIAAGSDRFGGGRPATTGSDGTFTLEALPAGRYTLKAEATGMRSAQIDGVVVTSGAALPPYELRMAGGVALLGALTGAPEADLPRYTVRAIAGGSGGFGVTAPVDAAGRFEIKGLTAGTVTLIAGSGFFGGRSITKTVQIPDNVAMFETTIEFPRGSRVEGIVTRGGVPVEGATVIFSHEVTRARTTATTNTAGSYVAEDLDDGKYGVDVIQFGSGISHSLEASVAGDGRFDVQLPLARISGVVKDASTGLSLDGAALAIKRQNASGPSAGAGFFLQQEARTDATGGYAIEGLDPGSYLLTARKDGYGFETRAVAIAPELQPDSIDFQLSRADDFAFRALDASSGLPIKSLSALVLLGGGDPLAPAGSGATSVFRGQVSADATGLFHLDSLQPGTYRIVLGGQGLATETLYDVKVPSDPATLTMVDGGTLEVMAGSLRPGQIAKAVLLDAAGHPAHVNTFLAEPTFLLRPGSPTTLPDLKPGSYRLRASMPGGGLSEQPVEVAAGRTVSITLP